MIIVEQTIISDDIVTEKFACNLDKCKGACCIDGDSGAPLEEDELEILESIYPIVETYMRPKGRDAVAEQGVYMKDSDGDWVTPLVEGQECAYVVFENSVALCAIEKAYRDGKIDFKKPISCHLYPIRITKGKDFDAVNYEERTSCAPACKNGTKLGIKVYAFLEEPLIRKFGQEWYNQLRAADEYMHTQIEDPNL